MAELAPADARRSNRLRIFLLGLDGMTLRVVEPYVQANLLPNFKKLMNHGSYGTLRSTILPLTPPAWTSLATGRGPAKHGLYGFRKRVGYTTELVTRSSSAECEPLWKTMSRKGMRVGVLNVPFTFPPDEVNGVMVSGMMTPGTDSNFVYPPHMKDEVFRVVPDYRLDVTEEEVVECRDSDTLLKGVFDVTVGLRKLANHFLDDGPWDLFYVVFVGPDRLQHFLWDRILSFDAECVRYYKLLDDALGDILAGMDDDTVLFVVSDHGFQPAAKGFFINNFFIDAGLLTVRGKLGLQNVLAKVGITSDTINKGLNTLGMNKLKQALPSWVVSRTRGFLKAYGVRQDDIDWKRTTAFAFFGYGNVFVNVRGRDPEGAVAPADYDSVCEDIREKLLSVKDPETGKCIVEAVYRGPEAYPGVSPNEIPDLLVMMKEGYAIREHIGGDIIGPNKLRNLCIDGYHDIEGLFLGYGHVIKNKRIQADICDIMPTALYLLGLPIPDDVDGHVLEEVIEDGFLEKHEVKFERATERESSGRKVLTEEETARLEKHLRGLGYMG
jgi:predicted AlkP superfamily phosphohydrolase/phosphomutase